MSLPNPERPLISQIAQPHFEGPLSESKKDELVDEIVEVFDGLQVTNVALPEAEDRSPLRSINERLTGHNTFFAGTWLAPLMKKAGLPSSLAESHGFRVPNLSGFQGGVTNAKS